MLLLVCRLEVKSVFQRIVSVDGFPCSLLATATLALRMYSDLFGANLIDGHVESISRLQGILNTTMKNHRALQKKVEKLEKELASSTSSLEDSRLKADTDMEKFTRTYALARNMKAALEELVASNEASAAQLKTKMVLEVMLRSRIEELERAARDRDEQRDEEMEGLRQQLDSAEWKLATYHEQQRCMVRDRARWVRFRGVWPVEMALARFEFVSAEFEKTRYSKSLPLTVESVPWPALESPSSFQMDSVSWESVEKFFAAAHRVCTRTEYKALVERSHRMFHPDRWLARGLMNTIRDENLRQSVKKAGEIVNQALTPIRTRIREQQRFLVSVL